MAATDAHEWLSLIDITGPFLAPPVLDAAFPQGLDGLEGTKKTATRQAYEEWVEAIDAQDDDSMAIHGAWIDLVLKEILEWDEDGSGENLKATAPSIEGFHYENPDHGIAVKPDWVLVDDRSNDKPFIAVQVLPPDSDLDAAPDGSAWAASVSERFIELLRHNELRLGLITNGESWRLIDAPVGGVTTFATWQARLWSQEPTTLQAFVALFRIGRFFGDATRQLPAMLDASLQHQDEVTDALGEQITRAVEVLIQALDKADADRNRELLEGIEPEVLYEAALTLMMRLVFLLCAEERELMDVVTLERFDSGYAVSSLRMQLREQAELHSEDILSRRFDAWSRLLAIFRAVYGGVEHGALRMPALGGSLFDPDKYPFLEGRASGTSWKERPADPLPIDNRTVLLLMDAIQLYQGRTLAYRALDVENIGYVYEGLLEKTVQRAKTVTVEFAATQSAQKTWASLEEIETATAGGSLEALLKERTGSGGNRVQNALNKAVEPEDQARLLAACHNDEALCEKILPVANLIRQDSWDYPLVFPCGTYMMTAGQDRRDTGSHYTPKLLTEAIVKETLEPLVYEGPAVGKPRAEWQLKSSAALLNLKICEPAMGSGSFLVQVCRWLGDRVVEAWHQEEASGAVIDVDGEHHAAGAAVEPLPRMIEERAAVARRLIAERCLYGVDINPLAVELAKLSVWLVTLAKDRPFGFLDHNLRSGDCVLGLTDIKQLTQLHFDPSRGDVVHSGLLDVRDQVERDVSAALAYRQKIRSTHARDLHDIEQLAELHTQAVRKLGSCNLLADAIVGEALNQPRELDQRMQILAMQAEGVFGNDADTLSELDQRLGQCLFDAGLGATKTPFHWAIEYPEVFWGENPGFDAVVGNPPFLGNRLWKSSGGEKFGQLCEMVLGAPPGKIDLSVVFHRRAVQLLKSNGCYGLIATSNIAEGSAISVGTAEIIKTGCFYSSQKNMEWPGTASVAVTIINFFKGDWRGQCRADGRHCERIGARLEPESLNAWSPVQLHGAMFAFEGVNNSKGLAFLVKPTDAWFDQLKNEPNSILRPYFSGDDITSSALREVKRWALDIGDESLSEIEKTWPIAHGFLMKTVLPTRTEEALKSYKGLIDRWWQFWNNREALMQRLRETDSFIAFPKAAKYPFCVKASTDAIYTNKVMLIGNERDDTHCICLSLLFRLWLREFSVRSLGADTNTLSLSIKESVYTFPLPSDLVSQRGITAANEFQKLVNLRAQQLGAGTTAVLNEVNDPSCNDPNVVRLRDLQEVIDEAVIDAYGWKDCASSYEFVSESAAGANGPAGWTMPHDSLIKLRDKLILLNKERYEEEVAAGLHKKNQPKAKATPKKKSPAKRPRLHAAANDSAPLQRVAEPAAQYDMLGEVEESAPQQGNSWGTNTIDQILAWLEAHPGPQSQQAILTGSGASPEDWADAISELIRDGDVVEEQGRYRAAS